MMPYFADEDILMIEVPTEGTNKFILTQQGRIQHQSSTQETSERVKARHSLPEEDGSNCSVENYLKTELQAWVSPTGKAGLFGLPNLGNTCYMNSGVQCISNIPELTKYFLMGGQHNEKNTSNPLGMQGKLAVQFGKLINRLWNGQKESTSRSEIADLKSIIGQRIDRFRGSSQQDAAELVANLLDLIHEDLNRGPTKIQSGVAGEPKTQEGKLAKLHWESFSEKNSSIIVDLLFGQSKSTLTCLTCNESNVNFDPFVSIQLPIEAVKVEEKEFPDSGRRFEFNYVYKTSHDEVEEAGCTSFKKRTIEVINKIILPDLNIEEIKEKILEKLGMDHVSVDEVIAARQHSGRITEVLPDHLTAEEIKQPTQKIMLFQVPDCEGADDVIAELNFFKPSQQGNAAEPLKQSLPRVYALTPETSILQLKRIIRANLPAIFKGTPPERDEELNDVIEIHVRQNSTAQDYCVLNLFGVESNSSVETAAAATVGSI